METLIADLLKIPEEAVQHCHDDLVFLVGWELTPPHINLLTEAGFEVDTTGTFETVTGTGSGSGFDLTLITATRAMRDSDRPY